MAKSLLMHVRRALSKIGEFWRKNWRHKVLMILTLLLLVVITTMYGISQWYRYSTRNQPLQLGTSFIPAYAESLGVDPKETMDELLGIGIKHFRLVSYWNQAEVTQGQYDFSLLDWQFEKAEKAGAKITLTLGLKQPRWPECHMPSWAEGQPQSFWQPKLESYIKAVVERYKDSPALQDYQLENEYFLNFGICPTPDRERLISEYNLVKKADPHHPVIIGRSNNALGFPVNEPTPDKFSISVYKRVWDAGVTKRYLEYPYPAWFYGFLAGTQKIFLDRDMMIGELQGEAWAPNGKSVSEISLEEQNKSINAERLDARFKYGEATGMKQIYLWGGEYWYYRKEVLKDPSLWQVAEVHFSKSQ